MIEGADYFVRVADLPLGVWGFVSPNEDGTFSVFLNARATREKNRASMRHELRHLERDDLYGEKPIEEVEGW